ncbi:MAG: efflux transporter outer membrane subunit [Syntrophobacterales bacterium]|jgi:NodT family efflux transporter outer membrane factor (OMF) lipoprotein|nr:efflux transporter outer membrane subunit [Syntrophobacterales bacterium]
MILAEFTLFRLGQVCLAVALLAGLASGCAMVGPDYSRPPVKFEQAWLETADKRVKTPYEDQRNWWKVFKDPALDRLIDTAYRENLTLRIAGVRVLAARAQLGIATGQLYPQTQQVTGQVQKQRISPGEFITTTGPSSASFGGLSLFQAQVGLTASWELDFWGKFRRAIQSADASLLASVANYDSTLVSLTGDVASFYIAIRTLEKRLIIAQENVETQRESLQIAEARFAGGTTSERDVEQARTVLASTQATIPVLETQLRQAKDALCVLLGMPPKELTDLMKGNAVIPKPPAEVVVGIPIDLLRRRPDIRAAEYNAAAQCAQIGVSKAQLFPALSLTGNFGMLSTDVGKATLADMFNWRNRAGAVGPTLQWNIFNYGQITNDVRFQDAKFQELLITYQNLVLTAQKEVEDNLIAFLKTQEQAKFLGESADAALRSVNLAVLQYREGITDFTTVLTAQQSLLSAQDTLASAQGSISSNLVGVFRSLGGGWQIREGQDFVPASTREDMEKRTNWGKLLTPAGQAAPSPEQPKSLIRPPDW